MADIREKFLFKLERLINEHMKTYDTMVKSGMPLEGLGVLLRSNLPALVNMAMEEVKFESESQ